MHQPSSLQEQLPFSLPQSAFLDRTESTESSIQQAPASSSPMQLGADIFEEKQGLAEDRLELSARSTPTPSIPISRYASLGRLPELEQTWSGCSDVYSSSPCISTSAGLLRPYRTPSVPLARSYCEPTEHATGLPSFQHQAMIEALARSQPSQVAVFDWDHTSFCGDAAMMTVYHLLMSHKLRLSYKDMEQFFPARFYDERTQQWLHLIGPQRINISLLRQDILRLYQACQQHRDTVAADVYKQRFLIKTCHFVTAVNQDRQLSLRQKGYHWLSMLKGWREQELQEMVGKAYQQMEKMAGKTLVCLEDRADRTSYTTFQLPRVAPQQEIRQLMHYLVDHGHPVVVVTANYQTLVQALMRHLAYPKVKVLGVLAAIDHDHEGRILGHPIDIMPLVWGEGKAKTLQREQLSPWLVAGDSSGDIAMMKLPDVQLRMLMQHRCGGTAELVSQLCHGDDPSLNAQELLLRHRLIVQPVCSKRGTFLTAA